MMQRNTIEIPLGGKTIGFRSGPLAVALAIKQCGSKGTNDFFDRIVAQDLEAVLALYYGAAMQYAIKNRLPTDFNIADVSDWLEEMGFEQAQKVTHVLLESFNDGKDDEKKATPPPPPGENK